MKTLTKNMKKVCLFTFVMAAFALAQEAAPETAPAQVPENVDPAVAPAEAAAPETQQAEAPKVQTAQPEEAKVAEPVEAAASSETAPSTPFAVLHGNAYNTVGNEAAADNVNGLFGRPDLFFGKKFFYVEPAGEMGVASLGSFFAAMDLSGDLGRATLGYAANGFGVAIHAGLGRFAIDGDNGKKSGSRNGDDVGFVVSKVLAGYALVLSGDWNTLADEVNAQPKVGKPVEETYEELGANLSLSNGPSANQNFWTTGVSFARHKDERKVAGIAKNLGAESYIKVAPFFNFGTAALKKDRARLLLGLNTSVPLYIPDEVKVEREDGDTVKTSMFELDVKLSPNVLAEVSVLESLMLFGEASYTWYVLNYTSGTDIYNDEYTDIETESQMVSASVGIRYQYEDLLACEFSFGDSFFTDTKSIFNGEGVFVRFGGFVYF